MKPDNALSRIIRPAVLVWFSLVFTVLMIIDGNIENFTVKGAYITLLETVLVVIYTAYFLGKSGEHISRITKGEEYGESRRNEVFRRGQESYGAHDEIKRERLYEGEDHD